MRVVRITQGNTLNFDGLNDAQYLTAPEWRAGGIGAELVIPQTGGYSLGQLLPLTCVTMTYQFNLVSLSKYQFAVRVYGNATGVSLPLLDSLAITSGSSNDLDAVAATEIELDLGALQAITPETPPTSAPPATTPGGTAPAPITPVLSFPAGTSNLPSRR